MFIILSQ